MGRDTKRIRGTQRAGRALTFSVALAFLANACNSGRENPSELRDTTGLTIPWDCSDKGCSFEPSKVFDTCGEPVGYTGVSDRFFLLCASTLLTSADGAAIGSTWLPIDCRAAACNTDTDCPLFQNHVYTCEHGVCEDRSSEDLEPEDVIALCMPSTRRPTECSESSPEADALVAANCSTPSSAGCTIPADCLQP